MPGMYVRRLTDTGVCTDSRSADEMEKLIREGLPHPHAPELYRIDERTIGIRRRDGGEDDPADVFRWEDPDENPAAVVFGKVEGATKVHMAYAKSGKLLCRSATYVGTVLCGPCGMYPAPADDGLPGTIAALLQADVSPSRLCRSCFYIRTVTLYAAAYLKQAESADQTA
jgi:hypothetical protein